MAPQSAEELYASALAAKLDDALAKVGSQLAPQPAQPDVTEPTTRPKRTPHRASIPNSERHSRKCQICCHPEREVIEAAYVDWNKAGWIEKHYGLTGETTLYRHARATGLDIRRRENLRIVVDKVLEHVNYIETPSPSALLRAVRTCACLNDRGQWVEPPTTHVAVSATQPPVQSANPSATTSPKPARRPSLKTISNRQTYEKLEVAATPSKQKPEVISNR